MRMRSEQVCECGAPLKLAEGDVPRPQGRQVLRKRLAAGVCHCDLHIWDGYYEVGGGRKLNLVERGIKLPLTMGHENVGEVIEVGPEATAFSFILCCINKVRPNCHKTRHKTHPVDKLEL